MDYSKHYDRLISKGKNRILEGYCEKHHIIPKCMDGTDVDENLVRLTPEEHYLAHLLLVKIHPNVNGLLYAVHLMGNLGNNKEYGWAKRKHSKMLSEIRGENHPLYGRPAHNKGSKHTEDAILKMRKPRRSSTNFKKLKGRNSPNYGKKHSDESIAKMQQPKPDGFAVGEANSMYGKKHSDESKLLMSTKAKNRKTEKCVHCNKEMMISHIVRYHNDKCKYKDSK